MMKNLLMVLAFSAACLATPFTVYTDASEFHLATGAGSITPGVSGAIAQTGPGEYFLSLDNNRGTASDRFVVLTFSVPLTAFGAWFDNRPYQPGTGIDPVLSNGSDPAVFGAGAAFVGFWGIQSEEAFTWLRLDTLPDFRIGGTTYIKERLLMWDVVGTPEQVSGVPEPASWAVGGLGLALIGWGMVRDSGKRESAERKALEERQ